MKHNVLFVDDEENILKAMNRIFHGSPFQLFFATSGQAGLEILKEHTISVIISDMKMPGMSGTEFLRLSEDYSPHAVRIILSGYSEIDDILKAVNEGHVHNYLTKPWENERLKIVLYNGILSYEKSIQVQNMANELKDKNQQLKMLNQELEKTVLRRSRELAIRNKILMKVLTSPDIKENMALCLHEMSNLTEGRNTYLSCSEVFGSFISSLEQKPFPKEIILNKLDSIEKPSYINEYFVLPLDYNNEIVCHLIIYPMETKYRKYIPEIINLSTIVKLIIQQFMNLKDSKCFLESIDDLMEGIGD